MCVCGIRTQFVICESKFGAASHPPSWPVEPTPSKPTRHGFALRGGRMVTEMLRWRRWKRWRSRLHQGAMAADAGAFGYDENSCVAQVPTSSSSRPVSVGEGGQDRFPDTARGVPLVRPGTNHVTTTCLPISWPAASQAFHDRTLLVQGHHLAPTPYPPYVAKLYSPFYSFLPPSLWLAECHFSWTCTTPLPALPEGTLPSLDTYSIPYWTLLQQVREIPFKWQIQI